MSCLLRHRKQRIFETLIQSVLTRHSNQFSDSARVLETETLSSEVSSPSTDFLIFLNDNFLTNDETGSFMKFVFKFK